MVAKTKRQRKGTICEDDISTLLQRYSVTTVLALLQEVAQVSGVKIDWNELVKKTSTGITSAREYQMVWRHLAYRDTLAERLVDGAEPMDDDSDLDCELEALPPVSHEASADASACVKVLIASDLQSENLLNGSTVEAPLTINIPNGQSRASSENSQGINITVPVSVHKQPRPPVTSAEVLDANGSATGNLPPRRKRKPWSPAEDLELIAAVQKCGEGNWANILKGDFKGDRTASQLSQRWTTIRKRQGNLNVGGGSQLSDVVLAARRAFIMAVNGPSSDNLTATCANAGTNPNTTSITSRLVAMEATAASTQSQNQSTQDSAPTNPLKPRVPLKKPMPKPALSPDDLVKAAAVAAGARIATPSDAASLLKAAQSKNAVHIVPGVGVKSSVVGNSSALPPNVRFIRTGLVAPPSAAQTSVSRPGGVQLAQNNSPKPPAPTAELNPTQILRESNLSAEVTKEQFGISGNALGRQVQEARAAILADAPSDMKVHEDQAPVSGKAPIKSHQQEDKTLKGQNEFVKNSNGSMIGGDYQTVVSSKFTAMIGSEDDSMIGLSTEERKESDSVVARVATGENGEVDRLE